MAWDLARVPFKLTPEDMGVPNYAKALKEGFETVSSSYKPKQAAEDLLMAKLLNQMKKPYAENANQMFQTELGQKLAQTGLTNAQTGLTGTHTDEARFFANNPLLKIPGMGGQIAMMMYLDKMKNAQSNQDGTEDSEQIPSGGGYHSEGKGSGWDNGPMVPNLNSSYSNEATTQTGASNTPDLNEVIRQLPQSRKEALQQTLSEQTQDERPMKMTLNKAQSPTDWSAMMRNAFQQNLESKQVLNDYRKGLTETTQKRSSTNLGKLTQELSDIQKGFMPGTNGQVQLSPEMQRELEGQYKLQMQKSSSDTQARSRNLMASNIEKTLGNINTEDLTRYAGLKGTLKKGSEEAKAPLGKESKEYQDFVTSAKNAKLLAHQVRQFYGDSIQPSVLGALENMTNPATWKNNPKLAMKEFEALKKTLRQEMGTYRGALKNTSEYEGQKQLKRTYNPATGRIE